MTWRTRVVNKKDYEGDGIYIGRPSKWGNPFKIGGGVSRSDVIAQYELWLEDQLDTGQITLAELAELSGHVLICWCHPLPCHGDVLAKYADDAHRKLGGGR